MAYDASNGLELQPFDLLHIRAFDPDQARRASAAGRVQVALVVNVSDTRRELVTPGLAHLAGFFRGGRLHQFPIAHRGLAARLPVDRPRWTVIVRWAVF